MPAPTLETLCSATTAANTGLSYLDRRADGRPLEWRTGLPPMAGGLGLQHRQSQKHLASFARGAPVPCARGRTRVTRDSPARIRYDMHDFVKSTVWANHDMLRLRAATVACGVGSHASKAVCVDDGAVEPGSWLAHTHGEHLHIHDDADGTTHMVLSAADATAAIACGWAHAGADSAWTGGSGVQSVTVFAPRCASELGDWKRLVLASVRVASASRVTAVRRPERL